MRVDTVAGACLIFTGTLLIYVSTLYASAAGGDASEFAFVACDHSIAHPPGYPTFTMLASVGTDLFRGEYFGTRGPAWGANFISAVAGAGCAATLYIAIVTASGDATTDRLTVHASAALGSGLLALQRNVWLNTIQSEVFGLNKLKPTFSRRPRTSLQSCPDRVSKNRFMTRRSATTFGPAGCADCSMARS